ncbi:MAG: hypothetical protein ACJ788_22820 [Ktedonobacteraceae bacterium]
MASPYALTNTDLGFLNAAGQDFAFYVAFMNPVAFTTNWTDLNLDNSGNFQPPPNFDTCANKKAPYSPTTCLGPNRIGFVGEPLYFDGTRSWQRYNLPALFHSNSWSASGNPTITNYHNNQQIGVVWNSPGLYQVSLTTYGINGQPTIGTRQVMIYPDRQSGLNGIISLSGLSGSVTNGGWQVQVTTTSNGGLTLLTPDSIPVGTHYPFVIMAETRYELVPGYWKNATVGPNGNFNPGAPYTDPRILFDGYVLNGTMHQDVDKDTLTFSCTGPQQVLQEMKTHEMGYYNATNKTYNNSPKYPTSLNTSTVGKGYLVGGLMTVDVISSILKTHSNFAVYHDLIFWNPGITTGIYQPGSTTAWYNIMYSTLGLTEGTIWSNIQQLVATEWAQVYCDRDGSVRVGPQVNYEGADFWIYPTLLGGTQGSSLINFVQDLGYNVGNDLTQMGQNLPILPSMPMPVQQINPFGARFLSQYNVPFQPQADSNVIATQLGLTGPPVLCNFSDTANPDPGGPPKYVEPLIAYNWPQDLAIYPSDFDFPENYTGRAALVKLIGTPLGHSTLLTSWWPQSAFSIAGDGTTTIITTTLPAGDWVVNDQHLVGDVTTTQNKTLVVNWFWEMARREFYAHNSNYTNGTITLGMFTAASLNDIVAVTRQLNLTGPHWTNKPFYITDISYNIDTAQRTWQTVLTVSEVTSAAMGQPVPPPKVTPKF